jgi:hypothetical protein
VAEVFTLIERRDVTALTYSRGLGTDFGIAGQWWAIRSPRCGKLRSVHL